jgi:hypothetical protein
MDDSASGSDNQDKVSARKATEKQIVMKQSLRVLSLTFLIVISIYCAGGYGQAQEAPIFHFDFSNAAGKQEISDVANKFKCISETDAFHVEKDKLGIASGVRVAMGARFRIPAESTPDLSRQMTASAWIFKSSTPDAAPILTKGLLPEPLQFTFGVGWRYPFFFYRNELNQAVPKGIWHLGAFGTAIKYPDTSWLVPDAKLAETAGLWYHVAGTFDEGKVRLYINGELVAQQNSPQPELLKKDDLPFYVGAQVEKKEGLFNNVSTANMLLNDLRLYDRAFSADEIRAQYNGDRVKYPTAIQIPKGRTHLTVLDTTYNYMGPDFDPTFARKLKITRQYEKNLPADPFIGKREMTAQIRNAATQPELVINGQREYPLMFYGAAMNYDVTGTRAIDLQSIENGTRDFAAAGIDLVSVDAWPEHFWLGEGQYDWEKFDSLYLAQIKANPKARIMVGILMISPPWFEKQYPEQLTQYVENGQVKSMKYAGPLGSDLWFKVSMQMVRDVVAHVEASSYANRVIGYMAGGGQSAEWYWPGSMNGTTDPSIPTRDSFRRWLREKYGSDAALQRAWNDANITLEIALVPDAATRAKVEHFPFLDPVQARSEIDFRQYMTDTTVRHISETARIVKEASNRKKLFVTYYGYAMSASGMPKLGNAGLQGFARVLADPNIDCFSQLNTYSKRRGGQSGQAISPYYASARLHNKMLWLENDYRTFLSFPYHPNRTRDARETISVLERNFGETLVNNAGFWWRLFNNNWFHDNSIMESVATMKRVGEASLPHDKTSVAQVAFIHDDETPFYMGGGSNNFIREQIWGAYENAVRMGAPFDFYTMDDLRNHAAQMPDYKLYIFLNAWRMDAKTRAAIEAKVKKNNAVAVWCYAPGYIDGDNADKFSLDSMRALAGFNFASQNTTGAQAFQWDDKAHPIARLSPDAIKPQTIGMTFGVKDEQASVLASTPVGGALAVKELGDWRSVYSEIPLTSELLQGLCDYAGVHVYSRSYDVLYANKSYVSLYTQEAGNKTISLPQRGSVREVLSGQSVAKSVNQFSEHVPAETERLYLLETK